MNNENYRPRIIDRQLEEYLSTFGAVCIEGAQVVRKDMDFVISQ